MKNENAYKEVLRAAVLYHRGDMDGHLSGLIAYDHLYESHHQVLLFGVEYGDDFDKLIDELEKLKPKTIWMVDFSMEPEQMDMLNKMADFRWIDHHKSAMEKLGCQYAGLRDVMHAACELTWAYTNNDKAPTYPFLVRHVGRYDVWDKTDPKSEQLHYGLQDVDTDISVPEQRENLRALLRNEVHCRSLLGVGVVARRAIIRKCNYEAERNAFEVTIDGLRFIALNTAGKGSIHLESVFDPEKHDAMMVFRLVSGLWHFSVYTTKPEVDLSAFCAKRGGGGHAGAAGFTCAILPPDIL